jgi:hypothetical protein
MLLFPRSETVSAVDTVSISFTRSVEIALSPLNDGRDVAPKPSRRFKQNHHFQETDLHSSTPFDSTVRKSVAFADDVHILRDGEMGLPMAQAPRLSLSRAAMASPTPSPNLEDL